METQPIISFNIIAREPPWDGIKLHAGHPYPGWISSGDVDVISSLRKKVIDKVWRVVGIKIRGFIDNRLYNGVALGHIAVEYLLIIRPGEVPIWWPREFCEGTIKEIEECQL